MTETTYYEAVCCEVSTGLRVDHVTARVVDAEGRSQYLDVTRGLIVEQGGVSYLPVGFVQIDHRRRWALVEFPCEAYSGAHRAWVPFESLRQEHRAVS